MAELHDVHLFGLPSQGNVYTLSKLDSGSCSKEQQQLLVGTLNRRLYSLEFHPSNSEGKKVVTKELHFTYIPSGAEIVSIDAFTRGKTKDVVIGIAIVKTEHLIRQEQKQPQQQQQSQQQQQQHQQQQQQQSQQLSSQYLNIYNDWDQPELGLENLAQSCQSLELDFIPYHLTHAAVTHASTTTWLLAGSDCRIHSFVEDDDDDGHSYVRGDDGTNNRFPELNRVFPSPVQWISVTEYREEYRLAALGCECGTLRVFQTHCDTGNVVFDWTREFEGPVTQVRWFEPRREYRKDLIVVNSLSSSVVYRDVVTSGLKDERVLKDSENYDIPTCCVVADVDFDGRYEVLLGTYGQELLVYKLNDDNDQWTLINNRRFPAPILGLDYCDWTGDGLRELVVMTNKAVHILQHDLDQVAQLCVERLHSLKIKNPSSPFHQMLKKK